MSQFLEADKDAETQLTSDSFIFKQKKTTSSPTKPAPLNPSLLQNVSPSNIGRADSQNIPPSASPFEKINDEDKTVSSSEERSQDVVMQDMWEIGSLDSQANLEFPDLQIITRLLFVAETRTIDPKWLHDARQRAVVGPSAAPDTYRIDSDAVPKVLNSFSSVFIATSSSSNAQPITLTYLPAFGDKMIAEMESIQTQDDLDQLVLVHPALAVWPGKSLHNMEWNIASGNVPRFLGVSLTDIHPETSRSAFEPPQSAIILWFSVPFVHANGSCCMGCEECQPYIGIDVEGENYDEIHPSTEPKPYRGAMHVAPVSVLIGSLNGPPLTVKDVLNGVSGPVPLEEFSRLPLALKECLVYAVVRMLSQKPCNIPIRPIGVDVAGDINRTRLTQAVRDLNKSHSRNLDFFVRSAVEGATFIPSIFLMALHSGTFFKGLEATSLPNIFAVRTEIGPQDF